MAERGSQFVRRGSGQRLRRQDLSTRTAFPQKVMFWGCFSFFGVGPLHVCQGSVNSSAYISILEDCLQPQAALWYENNSWILMQDNAPCHKSRATSSWMENNNVQAMVWPANSPDLNPIENICGILKTKLRAIGSLNKAGLIQNVKKIWEEKEYMDALCRKLIESMPNRVAEVIKNSGNAIHY